MDSAQRKEVHGSLMARIELQMWTVHTGRRYRVLTLREDDLRVRPWQQMQRDPHRASKTLQQLIVLR